MNDFLTRIVQRHRGEVPTVRPRLEPLFAPGVEAAADQLPEERTRSQPATTAPDPTSTGKQDHRARLTVETESLVSLPRLPIVNRVVEVPSAGRLDGGSASDVPMRQVPTQERGPVYEDHRPGPERIVPPPSAPAEPHAASEAVTLTQKMVTERVTRTERVEVVPRLVSQDNSLTRPIHAPPSLVAAPVSRGRLDGIDHDTAEPPVQVTIGRIEVTAVAAPPAPKRKTAPRQPSISLQEYLTRRRGESA